MSWCRRDHRSRGKGRRVVHSRFAARIDRPGRRLAPVEEIEAKLLGREPGLVEVHAYQEGNGEPTVYIEMFGHAAPISAAEAQQLGWALWGLGVELENAKSTKSTKGKKK